MGLRIQEPQERRSREWNHLPLELTLPGQLEFGGSYLAGSSCCVGLPPALSQFTANFMKCRGLAVWVLKGLLTPAGSRLDLEGSNANPEGGFNAWHGLGHFLVIVLGHKRQLTLC